MIINRKIVIIDLNFCQINQVKIENTICIMCIVIPRNSLFKNLSEQYFLDSKKTQIYLKFLAYLVLCSKLLSKLD